MTERAQSYEGSCCCGRVRFRIEGPFGSMSHCHCSDCRKTHGAAFATYLGVRRDRHRILQGEPDVAGHTTGTGTRRSFCRHCGSTLTCTLASEPETIYAAVATLDTPPERRPEYHIFVRSKVPWIDILDGLPQHREFSD